MPMSIKRDTAVGASLVCSVDSTKVDRVRPRRVRRCRPFHHRGSHPPYDDVRVPWRRMDRNPAANVNPIRELTWICPMRATWYSTGSSIVIMFRCGDWIISIMPYSVVLLPLPVGPVERISPCGYSDNCAELSGSRYLATARFRPG